MKHTYLHFSDVKQFINSRYTLCFDSNSAVEAGADLYGGFVDRCSLSNIMLKWKYQGSAPSGYTFDVITGKNT